MRRLLPLVLFVLLAGCLDRAEDDVVATPVPLSRQDLTLAAIGRVEVLGLSRLSAGQSWFGGISGIAWDGDELVGISDTGTWLRFAVTSDATGRPLRVGHLRGGPLGGTSGGKADSDAEEITKDGDGWLVAFERHHRVERYGADLGRQPVAPKLPGEVANLSANEGIEAMTRLADGRLLLIAEGQDSAATSPAWIGDERGWRALSYPHHRLFRPTAAALLPDGGVLMVERQYTAMAGPAMRLVRIDAGHIADGSLIGEELARLEPPLTVDNFEALTVRPRADGRLVATLLSDDNFNPLQATLMLTVLLP